MLGSAMLFAPFSHFPVCVEYTGSRSNLERLLKVWRAAEKRQPDHISTQERAPEAVRDPDTGHVISSVIAAALCMKPRGLLTYQQAKKVDTLKKA